VTLSPKVPTGPDIELESQRRLRECAEFFGSPELADVSDERRTAALTQLADTGTYCQTREELVLGAKLAWRNHARCVGRRHWRSLELIDARDATTAVDIAEACWEHLRLATNDGALRAAITVGPARSQSGDEFRIVNPQLIRYAGYRNADGTVLGDPAHTDLTNLARQLGWRGRGTAFDVLPLIVAGPAEKLQYFDIPPELVCEVDITHPEYPWFAELGLKWHALPAISDMTLDAGGLEYPCVAFSGWYVNTEIGARNFNDSYRYNLLPVVAERLGLDTRREWTLWRDRALLEINFAVLHSFRAAGVYIVDHHTVAKQFINHVESEKRAGRGCPTDWAWINPPMSSASTPTFHRYYDPPAPELRPTFVRVPYSAGLLAGGTGAEPQDKGGTCPMSLLGT